MVSVVERSRKAEKFKAFWVGIIFVITAVWLVQQVTPQAQVCHKLGGDFSLFDGGCVTVNPNAGYVTA